VVISLSAAEVRNALEAVLRHGKAPMRVSGLRYEIDWEKFGAAGNPKSAPAGAIVVRMADAASGQVLCETSRCAREACESACAEGPFAVAVTDFLANGGDGLAMPKDAPKQFGSMLARDILVAYVKEHQPLTAQVLGAGKPRLTQSGSSHRAQTGE
jgi:hypothetical protein